MKIKRFFLSILVAALCLGMTVPAMAVVTNFSQDINTAIDRGLAWLDAQNAFNNPSSSGDAAGLVCLALLEKRASADQDAPAQGYAGASAADQTRIENLIQYIIARTNATNFYAYRDGANMMALSVYLRTGGPSQADALNALDKIFDRVKIYQNAGGYWCYTNAGCNDSSTTQLVVAGLASARSVYSDSNPAFSDPVRLGELNLLTANSRQGYIDNGRVGSSINGTALTPDELGHGYNVGNGATPQQTASGLWIQLVGGANLNDDTIQSYLRWLYNRYNYQSIVNYHWGGNSYYYFLWSSSKAFSFLEDSGVLPIPATNLTPASMGTLPATDAPVWNYGSVPRLEHLDPAAVSRPVTFGPEGAGYYDDPNELPRWYFDYAYTLIANQNANGQFQGQGRWNNYSAQAYSLLVLQRSVGGGCVDTDGDGVCDVDDNCVQTPNPNQEDRDDDGVGDVCDNCPDTYNPDQTDSNGNGVGDACELLIRECDVDANGIIDRGDILEIFRARNTPADGPSDPRDPDRDGVITLKDYKLCIRRLDDGG